MFVLPNERPREELRTRGPLLQVVSALCNTPLCGAFAGSVSQYPFKSSNCVSIPVAVGGTSIFRAAPDGKEEKGVQIHQLMS